MRLACAGVALIIVALAGIETIGLADGAAGASPSRPSTAPSTPSTASRPATNPQTAPAREMALDLGGGVKLEFVWIEAMKGWVGKYEVTNEQYRLSKPTHKSGNYHGKSLEGDCLPVCYVSYDDAVGFAEWATRSARIQLPAGHAIRLPDGNEWTTYAKCGDDRKYPWGNDWPPKYGNYRDETGAKAFAHWQGVLIEGYDDGFDVACPVDKSGKNDWGLYGVGGNVWELTSESKGDNACVMRGGSWHRHDQGNTSISILRSYPHVSKDSGVGFRVVLMPAKSPMTRPVTQPVIEGTSRPAAAPQTPGPVVAKTPRKSEANEVRRRIVTTARQIDEKWAGIPGIEVTKKGRLLVTWFSGGAKEPAPENVVYLTTSDDRGATFAKPIKVAEVLDGARAYDPTLWIAPNGTLWLIFNRSNPEAGLQGVFAKTCADPDAAELKWSEEFRVGYEGVHSARLNKPIVLATGEWVTPAMHLPKTEKWPGKVRSHGVGISTDQGKTWTLRGSVEAPGHSLENMIVERKDGSLVMYIRCAAGVIWQSESRDRGQTWSAGGPTTISNLGSRFHIRRLPDGDWLLINSPDPKKRTAIVACLSRDEGATWSQPLVLDERNNVSYPDAAVAPDGTIYAVHDRERSLYGEILLSVFGKDAIPATSAATTRP